VYGSLLVAIGACIGIVIGSVSETPRLLLERVRGPVETIELAPSPSAPEAAPPLEAFDELQGAPAKPEPKRAAAPAPPAPAASPVARAAPAAPPQVSSPPPAAAAPVPAKSAEELVRALEKKTEPGAKSVVQVLSLAERKQADALVTKLKSQGLDPYVSPMPDKSGRFRVRVRPTAGQSVAELETRLKTLGLKTWATAE
jgi:cell division septation protein DedD